MTVVISLLRGVNVGGHGRVKSKALEDAYRGIGFDAVRCVLQSGNVLFRAPLANRAQLATRIRQELARRLELDVEVVLRTLAEIETIVARGPLLPERADFSKLLVMFLAGVPDASAEARLRKAHAGPEMLEPRGPEVYLYYPNGVGRSRLTPALIESELGTSGTARNWNTILKLVEAGRALARE